MKHKELVAGVKQGRRRSGVHTHEQPRPPAVALVAPLPKAVVAAAAAAAAAAAPTAAATAAAAAAAAAAATAAAAVAASQVGLHSTTSCTEMAIHRLRDKRRRDSADMPHKSQSAGMLRAQGSARSPPEFRSVASTSCSSRATTCGTGPRAQH